MDNEILLELLESYIKDHDISTREILEAVDRSASYLLKDLIDELVKPSEPEGENYEIPKPKLNINQ